MRRSSRRPRQQRGAGRGAPRRCRQRTSRPGPRPRRVQSPQRHRPARSLHQDAHRRTAPRCPRRQRGMRRHPSIRVGGHAVTCHRPPCSTQRRLRGRCRRVAIGRRIGRLGGRPRAPRARPEAGGRTAGGSPGAEAGGTAVVSVPPPSPVTTITTTGASPLKGWNGWAPMCSRRARSMCSVARSKRSATWRSTTRRLTLHVLHLPSRRVRQVFPSVGYWLDRHNRWSTSQTALHTLAFDLLFIGQTSNDSRLSDPAPPSHRAPPPLGLGCRSPATRSTPS